MIYFIGNKEYNWVKIGYSFDPIGRLSGVQSSCPIELTLFKTEDGGQSIEQRFHEMFSLQRIRGEWFTLSGPIQDYINADKTITKYKRKDCTDYYDIVIELYNQGIGMKAISKELNISLGSVRLLVDRYKVKQVIREKLNDRMKI